MLETAASAVAVAAAGAVLLVRLVPDVWRKPIFVDEVVTGLTATRPLPELLATVVADRGGAPAHFALVHLVFLVDTSAESLRWLSVFCAVATVAVAFDLGRRVHGPLAGAAAAGVVAASPLLGVYGTFGRMYALFALVAAAAADLAVRASRSSGTLAGAAAVAAAALLPLVHPYGLPAAAVLLAAAALRWRRRPLRLGVLAVVAAAVAVPAAIAGARLADRFAVAQGARRARLLGPEETLDYAWRTLRELAGGTPLLAAVAVVLAVAGAAALWRAQREIVVVTLAGMALPVLLLAVLPTGRPQGLAHLSPRHLIFALAPWALLVGTGAATAARRLPPPLAPVAIAALVVAFALGAREAADDPRTASGASRVAGRRQALQAPAAWLGRVSEPDDLLFFASPVYLEALPATREGRLLDPAPGGVLARTLERASFPAPGAVLAVPHGRTHVDAARVRAALGSRAQLYDSSAWLVIRFRGPFARPAPALRSLHDGIRAVAAATDAPSRRLRAYYETNEANLCGALRQQGAACEPP